MAHALRLSLATAAFLFLFGIVMKAPAADLDKPATLDELIKMAPSPKALEGCFGEIHASGDFLAIGERKANGGVGAGCSVRIAKMLSLGFGLRMNIGENRSGSGNFRLEFDVNPHLKIYPMIEWDWTKWEAFDVGKLNVGLGAETSLADSPFSLYTEATTAVAKAGPNVDKNDIRGMVGLRARLNWLGK